MQLLGRGFSLWNNKINSFWLFFSICRFSIFCCCFDVVLENLRCPGCCTAFASEARLGKHFTVSQLCLTKWESMVGTQKVLHRSRYTIDTKCKVLDELVELEQKKVPMAQSVLRLRHSGMISAKNISTWSKLRELLFAARDEGYGKSQSVVLASRIRFKEQDDVLYLLFLLRRQDGDETDDDWLRGNMDFLLSEMRPMFWDQFKCSNGWLWGFKKRYRITVQCQTNKKDLPIAAKLPVIRKFHAWLNIDVQARLPQRCSYYGR